MDDERALKEKERRDEIVQLLLLLLQGRPDTLQVTGGWKITAGGISEFVWRM